MFSILTQHFTALRTDTETWKHYSVWLIVEFAPNSNVLMKWRDKSCMKWAVDNVSLDKYHYNMVYWDFNRRWIIGCHFSGFKHGKTENNKMNLYIQSTCPLVSRPPYFWGLMHLASSSQKIGQVITLERPTTPETIACMGTGLPISWVLDWCSLLYM